MNLQPIELLLKIVDQGFNKKSWHGTNLLGSLRRVTPDQAVWRPGRERHNIWEQVLHAAYWKYTVRRRLQNEKRGSFPIPGSDWFTAPHAPSPSEWKATRELLTDIHFSLREAIEACEPSSLDDPVSGGKTTPFELISGVAAHDIYHAGQIQLLKKQWQDAAKNDAGG